MSPLPYIALNIILFGLLLLAIKIDPRTRSIDLRFIGFIIIAGVTQIFLTSVQPFMGLEYEDAYVFSVHAKRLFEHFTSTVDPLQTHVCILGSLVDCELDATSGGHLINVPSITWLFHYVFGYTPFQTNYNNIFFSILSSLVLYLTLCRFNSSPYIAICLSVAYIITPAMAVFHASALSETISSFYLCVFIYAYSGLFCQQTSVISRSQIFINFTIGIFSFALLLLTKRDNSAAITLPLILLLFQLNKLEKQNYQLIFVGFLFFVFLTYFASYNFLDVEANEKIEIEAPTFSIKYFFILAPIFLKALANPLWFFFLPFFSAYGAFISIFTQENRFEKFTITVMTLVYLIMYCSHYRGYYFIKSGSIDAFDSLRYITNFFPLMIILTSFALKDLIFRMRDSSLLSVLSINKCVLVFLTSNLILFTFLWHDWSSHEDAEMIMPAKTITKKLANSNIYLMTESPLVFQLFGSPNLHIIDQNMIGRGISEKRINEIGLATGVIYWAFNPNSLIRDQDRYKAAAYYLTPLKLEACQEIGSIKYCEINYRR